MNDTSPNFGHCISIQNQLIKMMKTSAKKYGAEWKNNRYLLKTFIIKKKNRRNFL